MKKCFASYLEAGWASCVVCFPDPFRIYVQGSSVINWHIQLASTPDNLSSLITDRLNERIKLHGRL